MMKVMRVALLLLALAVMAAEGTYIVSLMREYGLIWAGHGNRWLLYGSLIFCWMVLRFTERLEKVEAK